MLRGLETDPNPLLISLLGSSFQERKLAPAERISDIPDHWIAVQKKPGKQANRRFPTEEILPLYTLRSLQRLHLEELQHCGLAYSPALLMAPHTTSDHLELRCP